MIFVSIFFIWMTIFTIGVGIFSVNSWLSCFKSTDEEGFEGCYAFVGCYALVGALLGLFLIFVCIIGGKDQAYSFTYRLLVWCSLLPYYILPGLIVFIFKHIKNKQELKKKASQEIEKYIQEQLKKVGL